MRGMRVMVTVLTVVLLAAGSVYAQEQKKFHKRGEGEKENIYKELELTPEQEKKLKDNRQAQHLEMQKLRETRKANLDKLQAKLKDPAVTRAAVEPLVNEIKGLEVKQIDYMVNGIFIVRSILTREQFVKFNELIEKKLIEKKMKDKKGSSGKPRERPEGPPPEME